MAIKLKSQQRLDYLEKMLDPKRIVDEVYPVFLDNTPKRSGNARKNTRKSGASIEANYPYAQRLDNGYSRQSPNGMIKPTINAIRAYLKKVEK